VNGEGCGGCVGLRYGLRNAQNIAVCLEVRSLAGRPGSSTLVYTPLFWPHVFDGWPPTVGTTVLIRTVNSYKKDLGLYNITGPKYTFII